MKKFLFFIFILLFLFLIVFINLNQGKKEIENPDKVIQNLYKAIDYSKAEGKYNCCIEPDCTMCYLGHWKFEKGTCYCDDAIRQGRNEDVCPECRVGLEEGICDSINETKDCLLDEEMFGGYK